MARRALLGCGNDRGGPAQAARLREFGRQRRGESLGRRLCARPRRASQKKRRLCLRSAREPSPRSLRERERERCALEVDFLRPKTALARRWALVWRSFDSETHSATREAVLEPARLLSRGGSAASLEQEDWARPSGARDTHTHTPPCGAFTKDALEKGRVLVETRESPFAGSRAGDREACGRVRLVRARLELGRGLGSQRPLRSRRPRARIAASVAALFKSLAGVSVCFALFQ